MTVNTPHNTSAGELTRLQSRVVRDIVAFARRENLKAGDHLVESTLAREIGTSRSPVNVALRHLSAEGVLTHDLNRGYFLNQDASNLGDLVGQMATQPDDPLYLRIAEDRLARRLEDEISELDLIRLYGVSRNALRKILLRIQQEGWIEKSAGYGWSFQPMLDSADAYAESYDFRLAIEPVGLSGKRFRADPNELAALRRQQQAIVDGGFATMTAFELFEANCHFHETLAKWSGNRFILQGVRNTDRLRRLIEYRNSSRGRAPRRAQVLEHLEILEAIAVDDLKKAASLMHRHLLGAIREKVPLNGEALDLP